MNVLQCTLLATLLLLPLAAPAERAYIIDRVEAGLHEDNSTASPIIELLPTGTEVEVLARADEQRVQVRTTDDQVGWLDARYLMKTEPTRAELEATRAALEASRAELAQLRQLEPSAADAADANATLASLRDSRDRLEAELGRERAEVAELRKQLRQQRQDRSGQGAAGGAPVWLTPHYLLAAAAVLLLVGMLAGSWLMDYRQRRRHGGFRV